jgi:hypothetical protein
VSQYLEKEQTKPGKFINSDLLAIINDFLYQDFLQKKKRPCTKSTIIVLGRYTRNAEEISYFIPRV